MLCVDLLILTPTIWISSDSYNTILALKDGAWEVISLDKLPDGVQAQISVEELLMCEDIIRKDERVIKLAKDVGKPAYPLASYGCTDAFSGVEPHQLCADGWAIGEEIVATLP